MDNVKQNHKQEQPFLILVGVALICFLSAAGWIFHTVVGPVFPKAQLDRVQYGMTRQAVREILGEPTDVPYEQE